MTRPLQPLSQQLDCTTGSQGGGAPTPIPTANNTASNTAAFVSNQTQYEYSHGNNSSASTAASYLLNAVSGVNSGVSGVSNVHSGVSGVSGIPYPSPVTPTVATSPERDASLAGLSDVTQVGYPIVVFCCDALFAPLSIPGWFLGRLPPSCLVYP